MGANIDTAAINMQTASVEIVGLRWGEWVTLRLDE